MTAVIAKHLKGCTAFLNLDIFLAKMFAGLVRDKVAQWAAAVYTTAKNIPCR